MRIVLLSFIVFLFVTISACSHGPKNKLQNGEMWRSSASVEVKNPSSDSPISSGNADLILANFPWLSIATPATVDLAKEYLNFLKLPAANREGFRLLADNELASYYILQKEMKQLDHVRTHPYLYQRVVQNNYSQRGLGFANALLGLDQATTMDLSFYQAWAAKGELAWLSGALMEARISLEMALLVTEERVAAGADVPLEDRLEIHRHLGWTLRNLGYHEEGLVHSERALALKPNDHELLLVKGLLLAAAGRTTEAISLAVKLPAEEFPDFSAQKIGLNTTSTGYASLWIKSQALFAVGDYKGAMHQLRDVNPYRRHLPHGEQYWTDVGLVAEMAQHEKAGLFYGVAYSNFKHRMFCPVRYVAGARQILGYPSPEMLVYTSFGFRFYVGGSRFGYISFQMNMMASGVFPHQRDEAAKLALQALDIAERRHIRPVLCKALRGRIFHVQGRSKEAEMELTLARDGLAAKGEVDARTSYLLGLLAINDDRDAEAQAFLEEAVLHGEGEVLYYRSLGLALAKQGKIREAEVVLEKAVVMDSYSVPGLFNLGLLYCKMHRFEDSVRVLEKAYALDNDNREVQHLLHLAASSSRDQGNLLHSDSGPIAEENAAAADAYVSQLMEELDSLFSAPDSTFAHSGSGGGSVGARKLYEKNPTPFNRKVLAMSLLDEGKRSDVQDLLGPFWGHDLDPDEVVIILYVDRVEEQSKRAESLARAILKGETGTDNPFIRVLALASLKGKEAIGAQQALTHLATSPMLGVSAASGGNVNGKWSEYMRVGFSNYRAAVHNGAEGVDYIDVLPDPWLMEVQRNEAEATKNGASPGVTR